MIFFKTILKTFLFCGLFISCNTAKFNYFYDAGKHIDFSHGKWLINNSTSNSKVFDTELRENSTIHFKEILGDSLFTIDDIRQTKLLGNTINYKLSEKELIQLKKDTDCDYIINIKGNIINTAAGSIYVPVSGEDYYATNEASVEIIIYNLNTQTLISSSQAYGKHTDESSDFGNEPSIPTLNSSAHNIMLTACRRLIKKYDKNRLDK